MIDACVRVFLVVPLLVYTGACILTGQAHTNTVGFHSVVIAVMALVLFFQVRYMGEVVRRITRDQVYQEEFGVFLLALAVFVAVFGWRELRSNPSNQPCLSTWRA